MIAQRLQAILQRERQGVFQSAKHCQTCVGVAGKLRGKVLTQQRWQRCALPQRARGHIFRRLLNSYDDINWDWLEKGFF